MKKFLYLLLVLCFSCQSEPKPIRFSDTLCENEKLLLNGGSSSEILTIVVDLSKNWEDLFKDIVQQPSVDSCHINRVYRGKYVFEHNDTITIATGLEKFYCSCCPILPPGLYPFSLKIELSSNNRVVIMGDTIYYAQLDSTITAASKYWFEQDRKARYKLTWEDSISSDNRRKAFKSITQGYLLFLSKKNKINLCSDSLLNLEPYFMLSLIEPFPFLPDSIRLSR